MFSSLWHPHLSPGRGLRRLCRGLAGSQAGPVVLLLTAYVRLHSPCSGCCWGGEQLANSRRFGLTFVTTLQPYASLWAFHCWFTCCH